MKTIANNRQEAQKMKPIEFKHPSRCQVNADDFRPVMPRRRIRTSLILLWGLLLGSAMTSPALGQESDDLTSDQQPATEALAPQRADQVDQEEPQTLELTPEMQAAANAHQNCVNAVMSTQAKAQEKREHIQQQCAEAQSALIDAFPEDVRQLVELDVQRQIEGVLLSLEQIESAVLESAEDSAEIAQELAELEAVQQAQAQAEVDALAAQAENELANQTPPDESPDDLSSDGQDLNSDTNNE